ncbi:MAG TPA: hypothetical protein PKM65_00520 [Spirochaetota bacterium]|nr:hypothetical protein [Spirochaetota bacterium]HNT11699.1 hypothetical protein [Spirochaetota bacterium]
MSANFVSVIFCRNCYSRYVEISEWDGGRAVLHCRTCGTTEEIAHFTLGRCRVTNTELQNARDSQAKRGKAEK